MKWCTVENDHLLVVGCEKMKKTNKHAQRVQTEGPNIYRLGTVNLRKCGGKNDTEGMASRFAFLMR